MCKDTLVAHYLHTAVSSEYYVKKDWEEWADRIIMNKENLDMWIYDVSIAKNLEEFFSAIYPQLCQEYFEEDDVYSEPDIIIGYYYIMYKEGRMTLFELLSRVNDDDDASSGAMLYRNKRFKELIHKLFKDILLQQEMQYVKELETIIAPLEKAAFRQQKILENYKG